MTLAGEVISHARSLEIRMMEYVAKEVNRLKMVLCSSSFKAENAGAAPPANVGLSFS